MKPVKIKPRIKDDEYTMSGPDGRADQTTLERREFLKLAGGGLVVVFAVGEGLDAQEGGQRGQGYPDDPNAYLKVGTDGRVTGFTGKIEMGQGTLDGAPNDAGRGARRSARVGRHGHGRHGPLPL